jgi:acyl-coenzyme A synthetase/AMP-(fatty) acid ligase
MVQSDTGRMDDQVKINGHRIELGEIASGRAQHPLVHEVIVITPGAQ